MYKDQLAEAGLYFEQLQARATSLKALNSPKLGDSLLDAEGVPWMEALVSRAPKLNWDDLTQTAALPLGSWLKVDPWDDTVHMVNAKRFAPMNASEKMPFEVTPIFFNLQRFEVANNQTPANPDAQPAEPAAATPANGGASVAAPSAPAAQNRQ